MGKSVYESKYQEVKEYLDFCDSVNFVAKKTGVSPTTINRIKRSTSYENYKELCSSCNGQDVKSKKTQEEKMESKKTMVISFDQFRCLAKDVDSIKQLLTLNNTILAAIHDLLK